MKGTDFVIQQHEIDPQMFNPTTTTTPPILWKEDFFIQK